MFVPYAGVGNRQAGFPGRASSAHHPQRQRPYWRQHTSLQRRARRCVRPPWCDAPWTVGPPCWRGGLLLCASRPQRDKPRERSNSQDGQSNVGLGQARGWRYQNRAPGVDVVYLRQGKGEKRQASGMRVASSVCCACPHRSRPGFCPALCQRLPECTPVIGRTATRSLQAARVRQGPSNPLTW